MEISQLLIQETHNPNMGILVYAKLEEKEWKQHCPCN